MQTNRENCQNFKNRFKAHFHVYRPNVAIFTAFFCKNREFCEFLKIDYFSARKVGFARPTRPYNVKIEKNVQKHDFSRFVWFDDISFGKNFF